MEPKLIQESEMNFFIFMVCQSNSESNTESNMAVIKAKLFSEGAIMLENINELSFVFSSTLSYDSIRKKIKYTRIPYLLLDIGVLYDLEHITGSIPKTKMQLVKDIAIQKFSKDKPRLNSISDKSLREENFELAAKLRDIKK